MGDPTLLMVPVLAMTALHYWIVGRHRGMFNLDGVFVLSNLVMAVGTLVVLKDPFSRVPGYQWIITVPTCLYALFSIVLYLSAPLKKGRREPVRVQPLDVPRHSGLLALFVLSLVITVAYYYSVGYNILALGIRGLLTGASEDYTTLRINSYASSRYLFPGYVNQFKNIILPTLILVWVHARHTGPRRRGHMGTVLLALVAVFALLGTGQRGAFILFCLGATLFLHRTDPVAFRARAPRLALVAVPLLLLSTMLLGRSSSAMAGASGIWGSLGVLGQELWKRFFHDNQWSGAMAYEYIRMEPTRWGGEWLQGVMGILPGNSGSSLARDVFAYLYGTDRGTAPISMWGSVYYNFSWVGLLVAPTLFALFAKWFVDTTDAVEHVNALEAAGAAIFTAVVGMWAIGGPDYLLNAGAVPAYVLWRMGVHIREGSARKSRAGEGTPRRATQARRGAVDLGELSGRG